MGKLSLKKETLLALKGGTVVGGGTGIDSEAVSNCWPQCFATMYQAGCRGAGMWTEREPGAGCGASVDGLGCTVLPITGDRC